MKSGIELIAIERQEQIEKHGRTIERDAEENMCCELKIAASALLEYNGDDDEEEFISLGSFPAGWDSHLCEKMAHKPYKERLIIAGALIAAEIDRLQNEKP